MKLAPLLQSFLAFTSLNSRQYWERRYRAGLTSGAGSYGLLSEFKAEVLNEFVTSHDIRSVIEFGCGDGNQLELARYPRYLGLDVSKTAIDRCRERFNGDDTKSFLWYDPARTSNIANFLNADLTLSLDVIYHLVEDQIYCCYLRNLFCTSRRFVIIYSSDMDDKSAAPHVRHRRFTTDVHRDFTNFRQINRIDNRYPEQSFCSFFIYEREGPKSCSISLP
jgi:SAM-dependent methyltransferase